MDAKTLDVLSEALIELADEAIAGTGTTVAQNFALHDGHTIQCKILVAQDTWDVLKSLRDNLRDALSLAKSAGLSEDSEMKADAERVEKLIGEAIEAGTFEALEEDSLTGMSPQFTEEELEQVPEGATLTNRELSDAAVMLEELADSIVGGLGLQIRNRFLKAALAGGAGEMEAALLEFWQGTQKLRDDLTISMMENPPTGQSPIVMLSQTAVELVKEMEDSGAMKKLEAGAKK